MYELKIYVSKDVHFVKVDTEGLEWIRTSLDNDTAPYFIEVYCHDDESIFAINRKKVEAYTYKEVDE